MKIKFKRTWCDYLTPCPFRNEDNDPAGIMVGDYECSQCSHHQRLHDKYGDPEKYVICF